MSRRWRPSLGFVIGGGLLGTLVVSLLGLVIFRYLGPEIGFRRAALLLGLAILLATASLGWLMVRLLLRPITQLRDYAASHEAGGPAPRPQNFGTREIRQTAEAVVSMTETLRDREATIRSFTDHAVHELKTPISAIKAATELLQDCAALPSEDAKLLRQIDGARGQMEAQLAALRAVARARETRYIGQTTPADALAPLTAQFESLNLRLDPQPAHIPLAVEGLRLILTQMLSNAAAHDATIVRLSCTPRAGHIVLDVCDNGSGIAPGHAPHVFDPFYTSRRETGGTGMGLAIVRSILRAHGADIELRPCAQGACFRMLFPLHRLGH